MKSNTLQLKNIAIRGIGLILLTVLTCDAIAQINPSTLNPKLETLASPQSTPGWIDFRRGSSIKGATIFNDLKDAFDLKQQDQMIIKKTEKDNVGFTHYRYQQYYKNLRVLYGEYIVHQQADGFVKSANGVIIKGLNQGNIPSVNEKNALVAALQFMNAAKYLWQIPEREIALKRQKKNENATYYPKGELIYAPAGTNDNLQTSDYRLAWYFQINTNDAKVSSKDVYVDALTGKIIRYIDIDMNCNRGSGISAFNGNVQINTKQLSGITFSSQNDCQNTKIYVYNCNRGGPSNTLYTDADNAWTLASQQSAVQAQWGAKMVYDYYFSTHGRQSWDNEASDLIVYNNADLPGPNGGVDNAAWYNSNVLMLGAGATSGATDDWNTDDIMGHEITHGVTQASAGLEYSNESGALNESFSDIFGEMVESSAEGTCDYLVGADRGAIRSLKNPGAFTDYGGYMPNTYNGPHWFSGTFDHGGVHHNSSVQNFWFYLLSEGGTGTNDAGTAYNITGISRQKARIIVYRALTLYLTSKSKYIDARAATLHAAGDLYGVCSPEMITVGDAWHAVGVESKSPEFVKNACGTYSSGGFEMAISQMNVADGCTTTVNSPTYIVYFTARDGVTIHAGFTAITGSRFIAYLEPCGSAVYRSSGSQEPGIFMSDAEKGIKNPVTILVPEHDESGSNISGKVSVYVTPNPFQTTFNVSVDANQKGKASLSVFNSVGVKVKEIPAVNLFKGANKISFNGADLKSGVYMIEINTGNVKTVKKIVKL